jgi:hypothetical protein
VPTNDAVVPTNAADFTSLRRNRFIFKFSCKNGFAELWA